MDHVLLFNRLLLRSNCSDVPPMSMCVSPWAELKEISSDGGAMLRTTWMVPEATPPEASILGVIKRRREDAKQGPSRSRLQRILSNLPLWSRGGPRSAALGGNAASPTKRPKRGGAAAVTLSVAGLYILAAAVAVGFVTLRAGNGEGGLPFREL